MAELNGEVTDVLGHTVNIGDELAGAFRIGNVAVMRVGTVLGFAERGNKLTVKVRWHTSSRKEEEVEGAIEAELNRFVRINGHQAGSFLDTIATPAATPLTSSN